MSSERTCRLCGCTQECACYDDERGACSWHDADTCSHCHDTLELFTQLVTNQGDRIQVTAPDQEAGEILLPIHHAEQLQKILHYRISQPETDGSATIATADAVRDIVRNMLTAGTILTPAQDSATLGDIGFDSLEVLEIAVEVEYAFPEAAIPEIETRWGVGTTLSQLIADVERYAGKTSRRLPAVASDEVLQ